VTTDDSVVARLVAERTRAAQQRDELLEQYDAIVAASEFTAADDEHDPDGATIGFERAQVGALLEHAQRRLDDLDDALSRAAAGTYGRCEVCGRPIAPERLEARPAARTCTACAGR
jgi:RNA polymerase-binding transcription factor DksA